MLDAENVVVLDAHLGGQPVALLGIESKPLPRRGPDAGGRADDVHRGHAVPASSKKTARAINAASGNRPLVVLANLSGFDGSPESLRQLQLEYGAEIGRAVVNFDGPIVFCVVSRYHGGAFVVFSGTLNDVDGGRRGRGLLRVGDRRGAGGGGGVRGRGEQADRGRPAGGGPGGPRSPRRPRRAPRARRRGWPRSWRRSGRGCARTSWARWRPSSTRRTASKRAHRMGSVHRIVPAAGLRPYLVDAVRPG